MNVATGARERPASPPAVCCACAQNCSQHPPNRREHLLCVRHRHAIIVKCPNCNGHGSCTEREEDAPVRVWKCPVCHGHRTIPSGVIP